jgi:hypothetical protein
LRLNVCGARPIKSASAVTPIILRGTLPNICSHNAVTCRSGRTLSRVAATTMDFTMGGPTGRKCCFHNANAGDFSSWAAPPCGCCSGTASIIRTYNVQRLAERPLDVSVAWMCSPYFRVALRIALPNLGEPPLKLKICQGKQPHEQVTINNRNRPHSPNESGMGTGIGKPKSKQSDGRQTPTKPHQGNTNGAHHEHRTRNQENRQDDLARSSNERYKHSEIKCMPDAR